MNRCGLAGAILVLYPLGLGAAWPASAAPPAGRLDVARLSWTQLRFKASKLFLTAHSKIALTTRPAGEARPSLILAGEPGALHPGALHPDGETVRLTLRTQMAGRGAEAEVLLDPVHAGAFQRTETELSRKRSLHKSYRYTEDGVFAVRRQPRAGEEELPHDAWSDVETSFTAFASGPSAGITEPAALLYIVPAGHLEAPGDALRVPVYSKGRVVEVDVRVEEEVDLGVDYVERSPSGSRRVRGEVPVLRVSLRPRPTAVGEDAELKLLGLEDDVDLFLEARQRVPLGVSGRVRLVGTVRFRLEEVVLR